MIRALDRIRLVSADPEALAGFYTAALGFSRRPATRPAAGETVVSLRLGAMAVDLVGYADPGRPYPSDVPGWSPLFQHIAIVVSDMGAAHARLATMAGWRAISTAGPERLPAASGGVSAFKFRDPEGHPLEFLEFPAGRAPAAWRGAGADVCLGIDHSAISVAETEGSLAFYAGLGLTVSARSTNVGDEQARLDDVPDPRVAVTGLRLPDGPTPHLELLCYAGAFPRAGLACGDRDIAATVLVFASPGVPVPDAAPRPVRDPDGHRLWLP
ncbi:VOC family protein [Methylobacterium sp. J-068]|uniref:VOC family protein n=1 Tax=Methylobacterium sp. J-068 TaxID=2836649 RepID=UPI001FB987DC|nr:VOC family protein [Methylobacterium sp. J-068]MCJ2036171.1 VOC family protein [Methylobacterium sp. J-068]